MIKKFFAGLAIFIFSFSIAFAVPKPETNDTAVENSNASVVDTAKIFSANQIRTLTDKIHSVEQKHHIRIGVNFLKSAGNHNVDTVANERLRKYFNDGQNGNVLLLVIMDNRKWNIAVDATLKQRILHYSDIAYLNDDFYDKLHNNDFVGAVNAYIDNVDTLLTYYETNGTPYDPAEAFNPMALGIAFCIAIILGFCIRAWLIGSMSNVRPAVEAKDYLKRDSIHMTEERDTYLYTNVSRQPKRKSSNGGGRSSGGGGSSGGGSF